MSVDPNLARSALFERMRIALVGDDPLPLRTAEAGARRFKRDLIEMGVGEEAAERLSALAMRRIGVGDLS